MRGKYPGCGRYPRIPPFWGEIPMVGTHPGGKYTVTPAPMGAVVAIEAPFFEVTPNMDYSPLQGGRDCYCGNSFANAGHVMTTGCNIQCNGDTQVNCGGFRKNNIYILNGVYN